MPLAHVRVYIAVSRGCGINPTCLVLEVVIGGHSVLDLFLLFALFIKFGLGMAASVFFKKRNFLDCAERYALEIAPITNIEMASYIWVYYCVQNSVATFSGEYPYAASFSRGNSTAGQSGGFVFERARSP